MSILNPGINQNVSTLDHGSNPIYVLNKF